MGKNADRNSLVRAARREYRQQHDEQRKQHFADKAKWRIEDIEILDVIHKPDHVDMKSFCGTMRELRYAIEHLYANDGRDFDPKMKYPPFMLTAYGKDYALHAQGIYYRDSFSEDLVVCTRKVWIPSLSRMDGQSPEMLDQQTRTQTLINHSRNNEKWSKSEYGWDADAWSDVFRGLRDDPCLTIDKHEYITVLPDTDPVTCHLTGTSTLVSRIPDITFGLATFSDKDASLPVWTSELHTSRLDRLMLHPKYGLISDPKRRESNLSFPFMVYEAKGWSRDCREARWQACVAAAAYLDMLDHLVRRPGRIGSPRPYQTKTSHHYQVFALTSFGAYWHVLVGYRRPRQPTEHAGAKGMSETVYIFQKIWSGHVIYEQDARELLSLIDQIHLWAITEYRTFVLEHLRPWHRLCEENYLLEWDSKYDVPADMKRKRACSDTGDLMVPDWVADMEKPSRRDFQVRAILSLAKAIGQASMVKGKSRCQEEADSVWTCMMDGCATKEFSKLAFLDHVRSSHGADEREIAQFRCLIRQEETKARIRARQKRGVTATGRKWPGYLMPYPFGEEEFDTEGSLSHNQSKRRKISHTAGPGPS